MSFARKASDDRRPSFEREAQLKAVFSYISKTLHNVHGHVAKKQAESQYIKFTMRRAIDLHRTPEDINAI